MKRIAKVLISLLVLLIACIGLVFAVWEHENKVFLVETRISGIFIIEKGEGSAAIYQKLFKGLETPRAFDKYLNYRLGFHRNVKYGYYEADNISLAELVAQVMTGAESLAKVTFPEGFNMYDVASALEKAGIASRADMIAVFTDKHFITEQIGSDHVSLEGFLSPGTYFFARQFPPEKIAAKMISEFYRTLPEDFEALAEKQGLSLYEAVTLASIVQKETYLAEEAPLVASVYLNRLEVNMLLQADPTIIYGMYPNYTGNIARRDLRNSNNIYNTYKHKGLTPTPICNPSVIALSAVAKPAETDYFYLVATKEGVHVFSKTYAEHRKNVNKYILGRSR